MGLLSGIPLEAAQSSSFSELLLQIDDLERKLSLIEASGIPLDAAVRALRSPEP